MPDKAQHVQGYLRGTDAVAALLNELQRRDELLQTVRRALPDAIRPHCKQASLRDGLLSLSVDSPVWVSRLKFVAPQLVQDLGDRGIAIDDCRVRALPEASSPRPAAGGNATFSSPAAAKHLAQAADAIADEQLASSLRRLAESLAQRTAAE